MKKKRGGEARGVRVNTLTKGTTNRQEIQRSERTTD